MPQNGSTFNLMTPGVKYLLMINIIMWLFDHTNQNLHLIGIDLFDYLALHYWESSTFNPAQVITYMFMHDRTTLVHLAFNMFNLWMFGRMMEQNWGTSRFLMFFCICGIGGALAQEASWTYLYAGKSTADLTIPFFGEDITNNGTLSRFSINGCKIDGLENPRDFLLAFPTTVGASAGTFGIMVAFAMTFPNIPLYFFFIPFPIKAKYMIGFFIVLEVFEALFRTGGLSDNVAHLAHLGGVLFGVLLILWWRKTGEDRGPLF